MRPLVAVVIAVFMLLLHTGPGWAQAEKSNQERMRQLEEELKKIQQEMEQLKKTLEETKKEAEKPSKWPIKLGGSVTVRFDQIEVEDQTDLLLEDNKIQGLRTRVRLSAEYTGEGRVTGGLRVSTGEDPNPTSPFIPLGNTFRSRSFNLDQAYFVYRPLKGFESLKLFEDLSFTLGKMPLPFWRGDRGTFRTEMIWDDDINPEGLILRTPFPTGLPFLRIDNTVGYFAVNEVGDVRFGGLTGDTYLVADQLRFRVEPVTAAFGIYHYQNLNAGLRAPSFMPGVSGFVSPGMSAILLREGLQRTNSRVEVGPGAEGFVNDEFTLFNFTGQAHLPIPLGWLEPLGLASLGPEIFVVGDYVNNLSLDRDKAGYGITIGLRGGGKGWVAPFNLWYTYRDVDGDATLATFADSDLGAGTAYRGFEFGLNYRFQPNLLLQFSYFDFEGFPRKDNGVSRWFVDLVWSF